MEVLVFNFKKPQPTLVFSFNRFNFVEADLVQLVV